jgi:hypothetical protein
MSMCCGILFGADQMTVYELARLTVEEARRLSI